MISKLVVIAGSGTYPEMIVKGAKSAGVSRVDVVAVKGSTSRATCAAADNVYRISIGEIASAIRDVGARGYDGLVLAWQINPLSLFRGRFDEATKEALKSLPVKNAHSIFTKLIEMFEEAGCRVLPASLYMDPCIPGEGVLTKRSPTPEEQSDINHAMAVAADMGVHDVGQTVVVKSGMVLAVEAFEGTNAAIKRAGKLGGRGGVIFKAARSGHDMRFDIPVIGLKTLKVMKRAGVRALAFQASRLIMLDREKVLSFADKNSIALVGIDSGLPPAPTRV